MTASFGPCLIHSWRGTGAFFDTDLKYTNSPGTDLKYTNSPGFIRMWHDPFISCTMHDSFMSYTTHQCVTWLIHMFRDSFLYAMTHSYMPWLVEIRHTTRSYVTWLTHMWHGSFLRDMSYSLGTCLIHSWRFRKDYRLNTHEPTRSIHTYTHTHIHTHTYTHKHTHTPGLFTPGWFATSWWIYMRDGLCIFVTNCVVASWTVYVTFEKTWTSHITYAWVMSHMKHMWTCNGLNFTCE